MEYVRALLGICLRKDLEEEPTQFLSIIIKTKYNGMLLMNYRQG
jgi:hypothetical protein